MNLTKLLLLLSHVVANAVVQAQVNNVVDEAYRQLQTLKDKWEIADPTFRNEGSTLILDYEVSDYIAQGMVSFSLWSNQCQEGGNSTEEGVFAGTVTQLPTQQLNGSGKRALSLTLATNSEEVTDSLVYSEETNENGLLRATIDFCARLMLLTSDIVEVNFLETVVTLYVDLTDGFDVTGINLTPYKVLEKTAIQVYEVEGFPCDGDGNEISEEDAALPIFPGQEINVCVRPTPQAIEEGITMDAVEWFDFFKTDEEGNMYRQESIVNRQVSSNGLTGGLDCSTGICKFYTLITAAFYSERLGSFAPSAAPSVFNEYNYCAQFSGVEILDFRAGHNEYDAAIVDPLEMTRALYNEAVANYPITFNDDQGNCRDSAYSNCYTQDHPTCSVATPTADKAVGYTITFSGSVDGAPGGCCNANSCVAAYLDTPAINLVAGDTFSYTYKAVGGGDWYEAAVILYRGQPPATLGQVVVDGRVVRGQSIGEYKTETFTITEDGSYFLAFFTASFDASGGTALGASMTVVAFSYRENPFIQVGGGGGPEPTPAPNAELVTPAPSPAVCQTYDYGRRHLEEQEFEAKLNRKRMLQNAATIEGEGVATLKFGGRRRTATLKLRGDQKSSSIDDHRDLQQEGGTAGESQIKMTFLVSTDPQDGYDFSGSTNMYRGGSWQILSTISTTAAVAVVVSALWWL